MTPSTEALRTAHIAAKEAIRAAHKLADDTYDAWRDAVEAEADKPADQFTRPEDQP